MWPKESAFLSAENFWVAWEEVAENRGCAGVDGETIGRFGQRAELRLAHLRRSIRAGTYKPMPLRQILIPKKSGGWRELGVPTVRDRIVQQALLLVLHPLLEPHFEDCSFAYRPGRSHLMAVAAVSRWHRRGYEYVLDADITKYFNNIQHSRLLREVRERLIASRSTHPEANQLPLDAVLELIEAWISVGVLTADGIVLRGKGLPQGAVISPILANVYLDDLDERLEGIEAKLVRFADDFVVLTRTEAQLSQVQDLVAEVLEEMELELHPEKTRFTTFKQGFRFLGHVFAGDVVVRETKPRKPVLPPDAPKSSGLRLVHAEPSLKPTEMQLALKESLQAANRPIPPPLFVVLGYEVRKKRPIPIRPEKSQKLLEQIWNAEMSTLYLMQQGLTLRSDHERFVLSRGRKKGAAILEIPMRQVKQILVFGNVQLTTPAMTDCLNMRIPVVFLSQLGDYKGHLWSAETTDVQIQRAQFDRQADDMFGAKVARAIIRGKIWNSKQLLLRLNRKRNFTKVQQAIEGLSNLVERLDASDAVSPMDTIRGYEGAAAAQYFQALGQLIAHPDFKLTTRNFHPPLDPMNSLLSFGYTLLMNNVFSLLLAEGLNPYVGHLHGTERQRADLALDLMEEFRSPVVDTLVMKLVNQRILRPTDFTWPTAEGGVYLEDSARRIFLKNFEERMSQKVRHQDVQEPVTYRRVIQLQIRRYVRAVLGNQDYEAFRRIL